MYVRITRTDYVYNITTGDTTSYTYDVTHELHATAFHDISCETQLLVLTVLIIAMILAISIDNSYNTSY